MHKTMIWIEKGFKKIPFCTTWQTGVHLSYNFLSNNFISGFSIFLHRYFTIARIEHLNDMRSAVFRDQHWDQRSKIKDWASKTVRY